MRLVASLSLDNKSTLIALEADNVINISFLNPGYLGNHYKLKYRKLCRNRFLIDFYKRTK